MESRAYTTDGLEWLVVHPRRKIDAVNEEVVAEWTYLEGPRWLE